MKNIFIYTNDNEKSRLVSASVKAILTSEGFCVRNEYSDDADFAIAIGGDGAMLRALRAMSFSDIPVVGVNTGHLGFFTELGPEDASLLPELIKSRDFRVQVYKTIETVVESEGKSFVLDPALNDVLVRQRGTSLIHLDLSIGENFIENFSGDGILIASSAGSTAYNYSLGGSIVDPRLSLLQLTPLAPANNNSYRSFTSSILLPEEQEIVIRPEDENRSGALVVIDGFDNYFESVTKISVRLSQNKVRIVRLPGYDFWGKVKSKFL